MRGSLLGLFAYGRPCGIIPAHAGLTEGLPGIHQEVKGSSPRMRGSPIETEAPAAEAGIIPAHAGLTTPSTEVAHCL